MKLKFMVVLALILAVAFPNMVFAMTYKDVPRNHYAYTAVDWVSNPANGSFMVGDAANNFNPNRTLDKFETAKIFAMAAGYKYAASSISIADQETFDRSYAEWKSLLDTQAAQYSRWSKTADREIAFLLYKNILTMADVASFITRVNGAEQVNLVTRQEAIVYMIRLDGKQSGADAIVLPYHTPYKDDAQIRSDYKKYIYYAKEMNLAGGSDGYINPNRNFTRAEMAQMFYNLLANRPQPTPAANPTSSSTETVTGTIDYVYNNIYTYVDITSDGQPTSYKLSDNAVVLVNNSQRSASDLVRGMTATAVVNNDEIISLVATSPATATPSPSPTPTPTSRPTEIPKPDATPKPTLAPKPVTLYEAEGYITDISEDPDSLTIETQRVKLYGEVVKENKTYTLDDTCTITRDGDREMFSDIKEDDIVTIKYSGSVLYSIQLEEKDRTVFGTLIEKKTLDSSKTKVLVIEDEKDEDVTYEIRINNATDYIRNNKSNVDWDDLRVGDEVEIDCEYDRALEVIAEGDKTTVKCELLSINISDDVHEITVEDDDGETSVYQLPSDVYDIYKLRIGSELTLKLDSWEIYSLVQSGENDDDNLTIIGTIEDIRSNNRFDVEEDDNSNPETYRIRVNANTEDEDTDKPIDFNDLEEGMEVYIELDKDYPIEDGYDIDEDEALLAISIQILSD